MRTALFVGTFLHGKDFTSPHSRVERLLKFLKYYTEIKLHLGFDQIYVSDNGGTGEQIAQVIDQFPEIELFRHPYMPRAAPGPIFDYLPCWRALYDYKKVIIDRYDKIITLDDDAYILSGRLINYVKDLQSGWTTVWCPKYNFPESALSVLCKDTLLTYLNFTAEPYAEKNWSLVPFEKLLPYTLVNKEFRCDRWGEDRLPQNSGMDAYFQCPVDIPMTPCWE